MLSIQKLLGREEKFFNLLEASAQEALNSVKTLGKYLQSPDQLKTLDEFIASRRKDKTITNEISEALCTHFVTALEREDIEDLSIALYKIPKTVEKIAERVMVAPQGLRGVNLSQQASLIESAAQTVVTMLQQLRKGINLQRTKALNDQLQGLEGEADKALVDSLRALYGGKYDPIQSLFLKDVFELLERVADRCRDAGAVITHIVLKAS